LLEPLDCCVSPVLTAAEAAQHPLFNPQAQDEHDEHVEPDELINGSEDPKRRAP
jgi:hypothetical protein